jgi:hypothetical protein
MLYAAIAAVIFLLPTDVLAQTKLLRFPDVHGVPTLAPVRR